MSRPRASRSVENEIRRLGYVHVAGVDEVGRGCLAGPVVAGAVILRCDEYVPGIADSKVLTAAERERLFGEITGISVAWHVAIIEPDEIDRIKMIAGRVALVAIETVPRVLVMKRRHDAIARYFRQN